MTKDITKRPRGAANNSCVDVDATIPCQGHARQQEADELRARVAELEALCGEIYQVAGALGAPAVVLDALHAAASGDPLPGVSLIGLDIANEIERAKRAEREPALYVQVNHFAQAKFSPFLARVCQQPIEGISTLPFYAATPVTAPVRLTDEGIANIVWAGLANAHTFARAIETASLRANGFDVQPTEAGG